MLTKNGRSWISPTSQVTPHCSAYLFFNAQLKSTIPVLFCVSRIREKISYTCFQSVSGQTCGMQIRGSIVQEVVRWSSQTPRTCLNSWTTCSNFTPIAGPCRDNRESSTMIVFVHFIVPAHQRCCKKDCFISPGCDSRIAPLQSSIPSFPTKLPIVTYKDSILNLVP